MCSFFLIFSLIIFSGTKVLYQFIFIKQIISFIVLIFSITLNSFFFFRSFFTFVLYSCAFSRFSFLVSRFSFHVSRFSSFVSRLTSLVSHLSFLVSRSNSTTLSIFIATKIVLIGVVGDTDIQQVTKHPLQNIEGYLVNN